MEALTCLAFYPVVLLLLVCAFSDKLREKVLSVRAVSVLEERIHFDHRWYWAAFAVCMIAGIAVRSAYFAQFPMDLNQDGTMAGVEAWSLLHSGRDHHGVSWPTYFTAWSRSQMSTLYSYVLIPFVWLYHDLNPFILRLPMLLVSVLSLLVIWDLARRMLGKGFALLALLIVATNPWQIMQSRWALEANLFPHVFLLGAYFLYLGRKKKWALYLSMVFFALTPYAYGVACFSTPVFLMVMGVYYLKKKHIRPLDFVICLAIFFGISWPYFWTMAINAFGWETAHIGPFTMPYFEESQRANDLVFGRENPYTAMVTNLRKHFGTYLYKGYAGEYNMMPWAGMMFIFMTPVYVVGAFHLWRERRKLAQEGDVHALSDGGMLMLGWLWAAIFNGIMVGGVPNRNNIVYYALILLSAYGLYAMGKRMKAALAAVVLMVCVAFAGFCSTYFTDEDFRREVEATYHKGLYTAISDTWSWDYDRYYLLGIPDIHVMFAHKIDYSMICEDNELLDCNGEPTGWYYSERYEVVNPEIFEPDPMECAVYVLYQESKPLFNEEDYLVMDYGNYAVAYPRYWAE